MLTFYKLKYINDPIWISGLGSDPEQKFDPVTGKEDFTEQRKIRHYIENWRPGDDWDPQPISLTFSNLGKKLHFADRIYHNLVGPLISQNAVDRVGTLLAEGGHILPMHVCNSNEKFYLWWVPCIENSVDFKNSTKYSDGLSVDKFAYNFEVVRGLMAFRGHYDGMYNPWGQGMVLVSEEFRKAWQDAELTGIDFRTW